MFHWFGVIQNTRGDALPNWQVGLVAVDTQDVVSIFADENSTPIETVSGIANRAVADDSGNYDLFVASGTYTLQFYNASGVFQRSQRFVAMFGEDYATESIASAADSASTAAAAAAAALETLEDVEAAGTAQIAAVNAAGDSNAAALESTAAGKLSEIAAAGANAIPVTTDNTLALRYELQGTAIQSNLTQNIGVYQIGLVTGTHLQAGDDVAALRWTWAAALLTETVEIKVYERDVAGATGAGTINNAAPVATHDTLIRTFEATPAELGVTLGTSNAVTTQLYTLPTPFTVQAGYDYIFQFRNLDAADALVNCAFNYFNTAAGTQRRAGFQALTASPTTFTNLSTARSPAISVLGRRIPLAQAETTTLIEQQMAQRDEQTLADMNARNVSNLFSSLAIYPNTLAVEASFWGDSLVEDTTGSLPVAYRAVTIVDNLTTGTVNNFGIGGQNASAITARVVAATADEKAGLNFVMMGANDTPASKSAAAILTDYASAAAALTNVNYVFAATWNSGQVFSRNRDIWRGLVSTYGAKALDMSAVWARYGARSTDASVARGGAVATDLTLDALHNSRAGCVTKGYEWAATLIARNGGAPYVHDDIIGFKEGDASGAAILTVRALGEAFNFGIAAGNDDDAVQINRATGAITRTANPILQPYREVFVEAENSAGKGRNGRIVMVRQMDGTDPQSAVQIVGNGASVLTMPSDYAPTAGPEATLVMCARLDLNRTTGNLITTSAGSFVFNQSGNGLRFAPRDAGGTARGDLSLAAPSPSDWNFYFFTIDTSTGLLRGAINETTSSGTSTAGNLAFAAWTQLFSNIGNTLPFIGGIKMLALYDTSYDVHDAGVRSEFYDSTTGLPKDIGDGTAGGTFAAPLIYLRGMAGDYMLGKNFGSGGDLHAPYPIGRRHLGFVDIVE